MSIILGVSYENEVSLSSKDLFYEASLSTDSPWTCSWHCHGLQHHHSLFKRAWISLYLPSLIIISGWIWRKEEWGRSDISGASPSRSPFSGRKELFLSYLLNSIHHKALLMWVRNKKESIILSNHLLNSNPKIRNGGSTARPPSRAKKGYVVLPHIHV